MEISGPQPTFLYRAFGSGEVLLYIGIASNVRLRLGQHASLKPWWTEVERVTTEMFDTKREALEAERAAIIEERPRHNVSHSTENSPAPWRDRKSTTVRDGATLFTSTATRDGGKWVVQCDQEPGALSQVARLDQAEEHQREAISMVTDLDEAEIEVKVSPVLDDAVMDLLRDAWAKRDEAERLQRVASDEVRKVAHTLADDKFSLRDVGFILGVSYQRAGQIVNEES